MRQMEESLKIKLPKIEKKRRVQQTTHERQESSPAMEIDGSEIEPCSPKVTVGFLDNLQNDYSPRQNDYSP